MNDPISLFPKPLEDREAIAARDRIFSNFIEKYRDGLPPLLLMNYYTSKETFKCPTEDEIRMVETASGSEIQQQFDYEQSSGQTLHILAKLSRDGVVTIRTPKELQGNVLIQFWPNDSNDEMGYSGQGKFFDDALRSLAHNIHASHLQEVISTKRHLANLEAKKGYHSKEYFSE